MTNCNTGTVTTATYTELVLFNMLTASEHTQACLQLFAAKVTDIYCWLVFAGHES